MKIIEVKYHTHTDMGCADVFKTVGKPTRLFNRDEYTGEWCTSSPEYFENGWPVDKDVRFKVVDNKKNLIAYDGNDDFPEKKPFKTYRQFWMESEKWVKDNVPNLKTYEEWKAKMRSLPGFQEFVHSNYEENWMLSPCVLDVSETQTVKKQTWCDRQYDIAKEIITHIPTGFVFEEYVIYNGDFGSGLLLYHWEE